MLSVSRTSSYAIAALSRLADATETWTLASELCADTGIPGPYLSKILHLLGKARLILSKRGYKGGFMLARSPSVISVLEVVEAVEGPDCLGECLLGQAVCSDDRACPTHEFWKTERERIRELLAALTLETVAQFEQAHRGEPPLEGGQTIEQQRHQRLAKTGPMVTYPRRQVGIKKGLSRAARQD